MTQTNDMIDQGKGPVLVLLHGAGVDNRLWEPQIAHFSQTMRVIAPNLPGHGGIPAATDIEAMATHVHDLLSEMDIRSYAVAGLSLGGMVALEMAARWPNEVSRLAMIESVPSVTENRFALWFASGMINMMGLISPRILTAMPARMMGAETEAAGRYLKAALRRMTPANNTAVLNAALAYDGRPHLLKLTIPTLVVVAEKNRQTHARARAMADQIGNCRFVVAPAAGHVANLDAPEFINTQLSAFFETPPA